MEEHTDTGELATYDSNTRTYSYSDLPSPPEMSSITDVASTGGGDAEDQVMKEPRVKEYEVVCGKRILKNKYCYIPDDEAIKEQYPDFPNLDGLSADESRLAVYKYWTKRSKARFKKKAKNKAANGEANKDTPQKGQESVEASAVIEANRDEPQEGQEGVEACLTNSPMPVHDKNDGVRRKYSYIPPAEQIRDMYPDFPNLEGLTPDEVTDKVAYYWKRRDKERLKAKKKLKKAAKRKQDIEEDSQFEQPVVNDIVLPSYDWGCEAVQGEPEAQSHHGHPKDMDFSSRSQPHFDYYQNEDRTESRSKMSGWCQAEPSVNHDQIEDTTAKEKKRGHYESNETLRKRYPSKPIEVDRSLVLKVFQGLDTLTEMYESDWKALLKFILQSWLWSPIVINVSNHYFMHGIGHIICEDQPSFDWIIVTVSRFTSDDHRYFRAWSRDELEEDWCKCSVYLDSWFEDIDEFNILSNAFRLALVPGEFHINGVHNSRNGKVVRLLMSQTMADAIIDRKKRISAGFSSLTFRF